MVAEPLTEAHLQFACNHCHAQLTVPAIHAGATGPCPFCHESITAPVPAAPAAPIGPALVEMPSPKRPSKKRRPHHSRSFAMALFEKKGFRALRTALSVAACIAIFLSFQSLKSRRWVFAKTPISSPAPAAPPEAPDPPPTPPPPHDITPPSLPNLHALSAGK